MTHQIDRRSFLNNLGVTIGAAAATASAVVPASAQVAKPKGNIPSTPLKLGHMTFLTGPGAVLGEPSLKGHLLAAEEINAQGGILGSQGSNLFFWRHAPSLPNPRKPVLNGYADRQRHLTANSPPNDAEWRHSATSHERP